MSKLPEKTVERLSKYRRALLTYSSNNVNFIFSHELAHLIHSAAQGCKHIRNIGMMGYCNEVK